MDRKTVSEDTADSADLDARLVGPLDISTQELLHEIVTSIPKPLQPGEVTRKMIENHPEMSGRGRSCVQNELNRRVERGELVRRKLRSGEIAYRKADDDRS